MTAEAVQTGGDEAGAWVKPVLDALVLYEDLGTALRAKNSLDLLSGRLSRDATVCVRWWRLGLMDQPLLAEEAAIEAGASRLIILSLHSGNGLRGEACGWLSRWLAHKADREYALTVLLDPEPDLSETSAAVLAYLQQVAGAACAALFCGSCPPPVTALDLVRGISRGRAKRRPDRKKPVAPSSPAATSRAKRRASPPGGLPLRGKRLPTSPQPFADS